MGKLMKYEFRKTLFSKGILLAITGIAELLFLAGIFLEWQNGLMFGLIGLMLCAGVGTMYIGIESITMMHKDLNTKQSYMLFLTPRNSYQILGAKTIENGLSIVIASVFYIVLAAIDISVAVLYLGGLQELLDLLREFSITLQVNIPDNWQEMLIMGVAAAVAEWLLVIQTGYLAVVLSATVLAGKRFSGAASFILFLVIAWATGFVTGLLPQMQNTNQDLVLLIVVTLVMDVLMYLITSWIMEKRLSV